MIVSGFLFVLGVVLCIWCLVNLDVVIGLIWLAFLGIIILAIGAALWLGASWVVLQLDPSLAGEEIASYGFLGAAALVWLGLHWIGKGDES